MYNMIMYIMLLHDITQDLKDFRSRRWSLQQLQRTRIKIKNEATLRPTLRSEQKRTYWKENQQRTYPKVCPKIEEIQKSERAS